MAIINATGMAISYECSDLIEELELDIAEFGNDLVVEVVVQEYCGVLIHKDYNFRQSDLDPEDLNDSSHCFDLHPGEFLKEIPAVDLLEIYRQQDEVV